MVRILKSGEVVPDDDPRAAGDARPRQQPQAGRPRQGFIQTDEHQPNQGAYGQGVSVFSSLNQRLREAGIPQWQAGTYTVEPIVSVGLLLALLMFGFKGLLFGGLLFIISKWSQTGGGNSGGDTPSGSGPSGGRPGTGGGWGGGGHRLGRS